MLTEVVLNRIYQKIRATRKNKIECVVFGWLTPYLQPPQIFYLGGM